MKPYEIRLEIAGPTAMWTRPDTGDCPVSYPAPTYSAVKGIFESVLWGPAVEVVPYKVEICRPLNFHSYATNYNGPLRKSGTEGAYQFLATVLINVCYRLYAYVYPAQKMNCQKRRIGTSRLPHLVMRMPQFLKDALKVANALPCRFWLEGVYTVLSRSVS